jgi:hypothetical protein
VFPREGAIADQDLVETASRQDAAPGHVRERRRLDARDASPIT